MHQAVSLRVIRADGPERAVFVEVADRGTRPVRAAVSAQALDTLGQRVAELLRPPPVLIPGLDAARTEAEGRAGSELGAWIAASPDIGRALGTWLGQARGEGRRAVLVVDAAEGVERALPWELLALDGTTPLEVAEGAVVARLLPGPPAAALPPGALTVVQWSPDPDDPAVTTLADHLVATTAAQGLPLVSLGDAPDVGPVVLHLIAHGRRLGDGIGLDLGDGTAATQSAAHALQPLLRRAALVVLDVCEASHHGHAELDTLAGQLVRAGARAVIAPTARLSVDAALQAATGLYEMVQAGATVVDAIAAARRSVRAMASPHPDARWTNLGLYVADRSVVEDAAPIGGSWRPSGWPTPGPDLATLLQAAREEAERIDAGFVGFEHLARAQQRLGGGGPAARAATEVADSDAAKRVRRLRRVADRDTDFSGTPRLRAIGRRLDAGATVEDFWSTAWADPSGGLGALAGGMHRPMLLTSATDDTLDPEGAHAARPTAAALEVLGGPEDGRVLRMGAGETLGRVGREAGLPHRLYEGSALVDPYLSRSALTWLAPGRVALRKVGRRYRDQWSRAEGEVALEAGDLLEVSPATCLRALP